MFAHVCDPQSLVTEFSIAQYKVTVVSVTEKHVSASYFFLSLMANITSMLDFKSKLISPCQIMQVS